MIFHEAYERQVFDAFIGRLRDMAVSGRTPICGWQARKADYRAPGDTVPLEPWHEASIGWVWDVGTVYFRAEAVIPPELDGKPVYAELDTSGECVLRVNGAILQGLDPNRTRVLLTERGKAGTRYELEIEATPRVQTFAHLKQKHIPLPPLVFRCADLFTLDQEITDFLSLFTPVFEAALDDGYQDRTMAETVKRVMMTVNPDGPSQELSEQLAEATGVIRSFYYKQGSEGGFSVDAVSHSHLDVAYLWPVKETIRKCARTFSNMLRMMDREPKFKFSQSQPFLYQQTKKHYPELFEQIRQRAAEGRWEVLGGMWIEPDCNIPSGESYIRQLLYGNRFIEEEFGIHTKVCFLPDTFGFNAMLPQILKKSGMEYFYTFKLYNNRYAKFPYHVFQWEGIDGTQILSEIDQFGSYEGDMKLDQVQAGIRRCKEQETAANRALYLYGYGDGGGGAVQAMLDRANWHQSNPAMPDVAFSTVTEHFEKLEDRAYPVWYGDLYMQWHQGVFTTQAEIKRLNRLCEFRYREAEMLGVFSGRYCEKDASLLHEGWELIMVNQFHDILPGSSIRETYDNTRREYDRALAIAGELSDRYAAALTDGGGGYITVFNPLSFDTSFLVKLPESADGVADVKMAETSDGKWFSTGSVPQFGWKTFRLANAPAAAGSLVREEDDRFIIETSEIIAEIGKDSGNLERVYHKAAQREALTAGSLELFTDTFDYSDAWNIAEESYDNVQPVGKAESIRVLEDNALFAEIEICRSFSHSSMRQVIHVEADSARIDFITETDWHESRKMLRAVFHVPVYSAEAVYDLSYGNFSCTTKQNTMADRARFEMPAQKWVDLSEPAFGTAVLSDCKYGYSVRGSRMMASLLKAAQYPDETADRGVTRCTYSFYPHQGTFREGGADREGYRLNVEPRVKTGKCEVVAGSFARVEGRGVYAEVFKFAEDGSGDVIVRVFENHGSMARASLTLAKEILHGAECMMDEKETAEIPVEGNKLFFELKPYEIKTLRLTCE